MKASPSCPAGQCVLRPIPVPDPAPLPPVPTLPTVLPAAPIAPGPPALLPTLALDPDVPGRAVVPSRADGTTPCAAPGSSVPAGAAVVAPRLAPGPGCAPPGLVPIGPGMGAGDVAGCARAVWAARSRTGTSRKGRTVSPSGGQAGRWPHLALQRLAEARVVPRGSRPALARPSDPQGYRHGVAGLATGVPPAGRGTVMRRRLAYVIGGALPEAFAAEVQAGLKPCPEFLHVLARTDGELLSPGSGQGLAGRLLRRGPAGVTLALRVAMTASRYRAIVTSGEDVGIPVALAMLLRRARTPLLVQVHGHYLGGRKFALVAPILRAMPGVQMLCLSEALRDRLVQEHGFAPERCHSIGYGVDTRFFTPAPEPEAEVPLVVAAGLANRDYVTLVEAVRDLPVRLRIAAASTWMPNAAATVPDLPANVELRPASGYVDLRRLYAQARCVVVPMHAAEHACGYAVMAEAMAMGRPVIATRLAAPCDFFRDGVHGAYVPPADVAAMRAAIARLADDTALAARQGEAARATMQANFSLDALSARIEALVPPTASPVPAAGRRVLASLRRASRPDAAR